MIPVIDLQTADVLNRIDEAYTTVGFAVFKNALDYADQAAMNTWFETTKHFFELPLEKKKKLAYQAENNLGYSIMGAEHVDPDAPADIKESFNFNNTRMPDELWPDRPYFKDFALRSIRIADELSLRILSYFDEILGSDNTLVEAHRHPYNTTRIIHYPAYTGDIEPAQMRIGEHSDYGTITLLWQINDVPGLQVQDLKGDWHAVPYEKDSVVVNIGDLLQRWTNDVYVSTPHRVVNEHLDTSRYSLAHFVHPCDDVQIDSLAGESKYNTIGAKEYLVWRLNQSY